MSGRAKIDAFRFARERQSLRGRIALLDLPRLRESLAGTPGSVDFLLQGSADPQGRSVLTLSLSAALSVTCQRCLDPVSVPVTPTARFVLAASEAELPPVEEEPEEWTAIVGSTSMDVETLVEDELILALPIAPSHAEGECRAAREGGAGGVENPFGVLASLKPGKI